MLIEAAKGGHTTVVQMLIDYPNSLVTSGALDAAALDAAAAAAADGGLMSSIDGGLERVPPPGSEAVPPPVAGGSTKVTKLRPSMRSSNGSAIPMSSAAAGTIPSSAAAAGSSSLQPFMQQQPPPAAALSTIATSTAAGGGGLVDAHGVVAPSAADYDMLHGTITTNPILEDLERKGLDAKSYIQTMLRRTEGSSKEEQIYQKEQILAELQRVEKELQEKAQAQHLLNEASNAGIILKNHAKKISLKS